MKFYDALDMGLYNLKRSKMRTILTTLGVIVGIGMLSSMISFGAGIEKNIRDAFAKNDLFTSLIVTTMEVDLNDVMNKNMESALSKMNEKKAPLNDSTLTLIQSMEEVEIAFPEMTFPCRLESGANTAQAEARALPVAMKDYPPFNDLMYGRMFGKNAREVVLSPMILRNLKILIKEEAESDKAAGDTANFFQLIPIDSLLGSEIRLVTAIMAPGNNQDLLGMMGANNGFRDTVTTFTIVGIARNGNGMGEGRFSADLYLSLHDSKSVPRSGFRSMWDILDKSSNSGDDDYNSFYVRAKSIEAMDSLQAKLKGADFGIFSLTEQLEDVTYGFYIVDAILGAIGIVSLLIAALGIINTMVMSILERKKEIGIMKAIGGGESDIRKIFFIEASIIGGLGGALGLLLGWSVTLIASLIINTYFKPSGHESVYLFSFPLWLIAGAMLFAIAVSLGAGLYPAYRAARIDPVEALRHD